jgi:hypothetical protein
MPLKRSNRASQEIARVVLCGLLATTSMARDAAAQLHAKPITDPAAIYELEGYSVSPPPGKNWFEMQRDRQQVLFGKKIDSPTHSFGATATSDLIVDKFETREQFQEYVNKLRTADFDPTRFKVVEFDSAVDTTYPAWCVRYRLKHTDRNAVLARNQTLLVEDFGVTCLHPGEKDLVVDVGYSERGRAAELKSELSAALRQEGESFMRSLKFKGR